MLAHRNWILLGDPLLGMIELEKPFVHCEVFEELDNLNCSKPHTNDVCIFIIWRCRDDVSV